MKLHLFSRSLINLSEFLSQAGAVGPSRICRLSPLSASILCINQASLMEIVNSSLPRLSHFRNIRGNALFDHISWLTSATWFSTKMPDSRLIMKTNFAKCFPANMQLFKPSFFLLYSYRPCVSSFLFIESGFFLFSDSNSRDSSSFSWMILFIWYPCFNCFFKTQLNKKLRIRNIRKTRRRWYRLDA